MRARARGHTETCRGGAGGRQRPSSAREGAAGCAWARAHDEEVEAEAEGHGNEQPRVAPRRHLQQAAVLRERVERVEHLDRHEHRERERRRRRLALLEVGARLGGEVDAAKRGRVEVGPGRALAPMRELVEGDQAVACAEQGGRVDREGGCGGGGATAGFGCGVAALRVVCLPSPAQS